MRIIKLHIGVLLLGILPVFGWSQCAPSTGSRTLMEETFDTENSSISLEQSAWQIGSEGIGPYENRAEGAWLYMEDMSDDTKGELFIDLPSISEDYDTTVYLRFDLSHRPYADKGVFSLLLNTAGEWEKVFVQEEEFVGTVDITLPKLTVDTRLRVQYDDEGSWTWGAGIDNLILEAEGSGCGDAVCAQGENPESCPTDCEVEFPNPFWVPVGEDMRGQEVNYRYFKGKTPCDDCSEEIVLGFPFSFFGESYNKLFLNTNGNLTFEEDFVEYTPEPFCLRGPKMIAPFFADVDLSKGGEIRYYLDPENHYLIVSWIEVGYFGCEGECDLRNTFQCIIHDGSMQEIRDMGISSQANVLFIYQDMQWTTGSSSGGEEGFLGSAATVGLNSGRIPICNDYGTFDHPGYDYLGNYQDDACQAAGVSHLDYRLVMGDGNKGKVLEAKDLLEFQAEVKTNMHAFTWSVWENQYVESFVLERCTLGETFVPIYEEVGTPYSGHTSYRHEVIAPKGEVSYRVLLKQIQGDLLISDTITFAPIPNSIEADSLTLKAWPNPFLDQLKLEIGSPENSSFYALITNENAQIIWEDTFEGTNSYYEKTLNLGHLPSGIYYLSVRGEREQKHLKLIKR